MSGCSPRASRCSRPRRRTTRSAGNPHAPRLVTLDEAFAGVDDNSRAKYLGLLATFDLDVVMTSEREWGCYPEVPGLAIAQLARSDGIAAVLVTHWRWDGRRQRELARPDDEPPETRLVRCSAADELRWLVDRVRRRLNAGSHWTAP